MEINTKKIVQSKQKKVKYKLAIPLLDDLKEQGENPILEFGIIKVDKEKFI